LTLTDLATVLATSTNRAYGRRLSILLERGDSPGVRQLRRDRLRWLLPALGLFLGSCMVFGRDILQMFRPAFADAGITALHILVASATVSVLLSLAPTYLKYRRRKRATYLTVASAALAQALLLWLLVPPLAATGAAAVPALALCGMYGSFAWLARRELRRTSAG
jgi:O-antigen/teichoic acid export membrane protein